MNKNNFEKLIQSITKRPLIIDTTDSEILNDKEYFVYKVLPLTNRKIYFKWKTAKTDEKMLLSFITAFTNKYKEPNPKAYDYSAKTYGEKYKWENRTEIDKEYAYGHHTSNMYSKECLLKQIEDNFSTPEMKTALIKYGFYSTEYGIGIFAFWETECVLNAISEMKKYLHSLSIPFSNEYSDARWVYRFKLGINKDIHSNLINEFSN